jgi:hypothetical protein
MRKVAVFGGLWVGLALSCVGGYVVGSWFGHHEERHLRFVHERDLITPVLAGDPAFENVSVLEETGPGGGIILIGTVKTRTALDRLRAELVRSFGEPRANTLLGLGLSVESDATPPKQD